MGNLKEKMVVCEGCGLKLLEQDAYPMAQDDPIDLGEFGGEIVTHICEKCLEEYSCDCESGCYDCQMDISDFE